LKSQSTKHNSFRNLKVALIGFGNVGRSFCRYIERAEAGRPVRIAAIADSSGGLLLDETDSIQFLIAHKESGRKLAEFAPERAILDTADFLRAVKDSGVSSIIESLPTRIEHGRPALDLNKAALEMGMSLVTVDKGPVVHGYEALKQSARAGGARFAFSGTTGVAIPDELRARRVLEIRGVLNGTTNYILTEMQESGMSFEDALDRARREGIAEPDPRLDIEGWDTASKILILAKALMEAEVRLDEVARIGIGPDVQSLVEIGRASARRVRLVGRARIYQGRVRVSVAPKLIERESPFYTVAGTSKTAVFRTEAGSVLAHARSGRDAISQTILDDLLRLAEI
jgi:homoserine dehydrogenase